MRDVGAYMTGAAELRAVVADTARRQIERVDVEFVARAYPERSAHVLETCLECGGAGERTLKRFGMAYRYGCGSCGSTGQVPREAAA